MQVKSLDISIIIEIDSFNELLSTIVVHLLWQLWNSMHIYTLDCRMVVIVKYNELSPKREFFRLSEVSHWLECISLPCLSPKGEFFSLSEMSRWLECLSLPCLSPKRECFRLYEVSYWSECLTLHCLFVWKLVPPNPKSICFLAVWVVDLLCRRIKLSFFFF